MKKNFFLMFSSLLLLGVMGCSSNDDGSSTPPEDKPAVEKEENTEDSTSDDSTSNEETKDDEATDESANGSFNFIDFELEVKYADHQEYEAEYEVDNGNVEAEIEDDLSGTKIKGDEASKKLEPMLKELNIQQDTPKEDAIKETLNIFDLPNDYLKFELEITFDDDTQIEFEDRK